MRLTGDVRAGSWHISAAMPTHSSAVWRSALRFAAEIASGHQVTLQSAAEADAFAASLASLGYLLNDPIRDDGLVRRLASPEPEALFFLARGVFVERFGNVFPFRPGIEDEDDDDWDD
jgi:hypothetical protein